MALLNAAGALNVGGEADSLRDGVELAEQSIDDGRALAQLDRLAARSQEV
jgi:anthranilate phosphoribosyltransferase